MTTENDNSLDNKASALYQSLPQEQPPAELDARILATAHEAVQAETAPVHSPKMLRWRRKHKTPSAWKSLAYAAVMVLCVSAVMRLQTEMPSLVPQPVSVVTDEGPMFAMPQAPLPEETASEPVRVRLADEQEQFKHEVVKKQRAEAERKSSQDSSEQLRMAKEVMAKREAALPQASEGVSVMSAPASLIAEDALGVEEVNIEAEVESMLKLYDEKKFEELGKVLKVFMEKHPGYALPERLKTYWERK